MYVYVILYKIESFMWAMKKKKFYFKGWQHKMTVFVDLTSLCAWCYSPFASFPPVSHGSKEVVAKQSCNKSDKDTSSDGFSWSSTSSFSSMHLRRTRLTCSWQKQRPPPLLPARRHLPLRLPRASCRKRSVSKCKVLVVSPLLVSVFYDRETD